MRQAKPVELSTAEPISTQDSSTIEVPPPSDPRPSTQTPPKGGELLPGGRVKMSGRYRLAAGMNGEDFILNDSNGDLQEKNFL